MVSASRLFPKHDVRIPALVLLALLVFALLTRGADFSEWQFAQPFTVSNASLVRLDLATATLDAARADLADLRLTNPEGTETPYLIVQAAVGKLARRRADDLRVELLGDATQITFSTGLTQALGSVMLESPARSFIKSVTVEGSADRSHWEVLASNQQIFREANGAGQLAVALPRRALKFLRLRVSDQGSTPVPFTGAEVEAAEQDAGWLAPVTAVITDRVENGTQTRLRLNLGAAHLRLASLALEPSDPLFRRTVTLAARGLDQNAISERVLAQGIVARVPNGAERDTELRLDLLTPDRELLLLIDNGDSPPLHLNGVRISRRPVELLFFATLRGRYTLYSGHRTCSAPRYDLPPQVTAGGGVALPATVLPALSATPGFRPPESLPEVSGMGAPLDTKDWKYRKAVEITVPGVQQLALDLETLARAQADCSDLRLVRGGMQLPYVVEHTTQRDKLTPVSSTADDPKTPTQSRWQLRLPVKGAPVTGLTCQSPTGLFERQAVLYEMATDERGGAFRRELGRAAWQHTPASQNQMLTLAISPQPTTDTLLLELENGDNPAINLNGFECWYPVTRLLFKAPAADGVSLYYGNREVLAPRYDLRLVAGQLLSAEKAGARLGPEQVLRGATWAESLSDRQGGWMLWAVMGGVVVALLAVIAKLMPKAG